MQYAKYISRAEVKFPTQEDYLEDGVTFKDPILWKEYISSEKPEETIMRKYREVFDLISLKFRGLTKIHQGWELYIVEPIGRVAKLNGIELMFPQRNETINGCITTNYNNLPNSRKIDDGWILIKETDKPSDGRQYRETGKLIDDLDFGSKIEIVWEFVPPVPEQPYNISKLKLKRAMSSLGKWETFLSILSANSSAYEDFNLAVTLMSDDALVLGMKQVCVQAFGQTEEAVDAMMKSCKSDLG